MTHNLNQLVRELRNYARKYEDGSTLGRAIIDTELVMFDAAKMIEKLAAENEQLIAYAGDKCKEADILGFNCQSITAERDALKARVDELLDIRAKAVARVVELEQDRDKWCAEAKHFETLHAHCDCERSANMFSANTHRMAAEMYKRRAEAAEKDLLHNQACGLCAHDIEPTDEFCKKHCTIISGRKTGWQWRGPCKENS